MCTISDNLKLCSCKSQNVTQLKNFWILKRTSRKTQYIVGEVILPANISETVEKNNQNTLLNKLNIGNCFDIELQHKENDILELHFTYEKDTENQLTVQCNNTSLVYAFKYKKGKWKKDDYNPFEKDFKEIQKGKIVDPFLK